MMKLKIEIVETNELSKEKIGQINSLKNHHWKHSEEDHMRWFMENIRENDSHLIIWDGVFYQPIAYLNIVHVDVMIDQKPNRMLGIGNVCVDKKREHSGIGSILMASANAFIKKSRSCGLLLCHDNLTDFYKLTGWKVNDYEKAEVAGKQFYLNLMSYDPFHVMPFHIKLFSADRNF